MGHAVERVDVGAAVGEHDGVPPLLHGVSIVVDELPQYLGFEALPGDHGVVCDVRRNGLRGPSFAQIGERAPLPLVRLAHVLGHAHAPELIAESAEGCAAIDGMELMGVADEDQFCSIAGGVVHQSGNLSAANHGRLVDHQDGVWALRGAVEPVEQAVHRAGWDARLLAELEGGVGRERRTDDLVSGCLERLTAGCEGRRLAAPRRALDQGHRRPATADGVDHGLLLAGQSRPRRDGVLDIGGTCQTAAGEVTGAGRGQHALLNSHHLRG